MKKLVFIGGGHAHIQVLKHLAEQPIQGVSLTLVSDQRYAPYSGMLPGLISGKYSFRDTHFDLQTAAEAANCRLIIGSCHNITLAKDNVKGSVSITGHDAVPFDYASINVGIAPRLPFQDLSDRHVPLKPISRLMSRWREAELLLEKNGETKPIAVVGAGAAGVEIALSIQDSIKQKGLPNVVFLIESSANILSSHGIRAERLARSVLSDHGIEVRLGLKIDDVTGEVLRAGSTTLGPFAAVFWATDSSPPPWFRNTHLPLQDGYLAVDSSLRVKGIGNIFAAGDCIAFPTPLPKAGVYAVRQGPVLSHNLRAVLAGEGDLKPYKPQKKALALLAVGNDEAILSWSRIAWKSRWLYRVKDKIDRAFMQKWQ